MHRLTAVMHKERRVRSIHPVGLIMAINEFDGFPGQGRPDLIA